MSALIDTVLAWLAPALAWAKQSIAEHHASTFFTIFGWVVDKFQFLLGVVICVVLIVFALLCLALWADRKKDITEI